MLFFFSCINKTKWILQNVIQVEFLVGKVFVFSASAQQFSDRNAFAVKIKTETRKQQHGIEQRN